jgi:hypothetical protein
MAICFTNTVFQELRSRYPTWEQLEEYLESEAGGLFRVVHQNKTSGLSLIRYEKGISNMDLPHSKWFRSVVWDQHTNMPVSIAPPKSSSTEFPFKTRQEAVNAGVLCQEHVDGFMINCFKRVGDDILYITSRSKLDASGHFHSAKSFRQLFVEAYTGWSVTEPDESLEMIIQGRVSDFPSPRSEHNEVATCFSFLVQHVEHRIVATVKANSAILIHRATVYSDGTISIQDTPEPLASSTCAPIACAPIASIPMTEGSDQISTWIHEQLRSQSWEVQGIVFKDQSGNRWRFRSESYLAVRSLRGNASSVVDRFVQLYLQNLAHTYLEYYPEDSVVFSFHQEMMKYLIHAIYVEYQQLHIRKATTIDKINKMYHPHLYSLHGHYLSQLRAANKKITLNEVHDYLRKQPWQRVSFLLRGIQDIYYGMIQAAV